MGSGKLDQMITLQSRSYVSDGAGGKTETWTDFATDANPWAAVKARFGREGTTSDQVTATATTTFTIRNRSDVSENDRIIWNSETFNIRSVLRMGDRELYLQIDAERGVPS